MNRRTKDILQNLAFTAMHAVLYTLVVAAIIFVVRLVTNPDLSDCMKICGERGVQVCDPPTVRCGEAP